jgi:hypothetical protein
MRPLDMSGTNEMARDLFEQEPGRDKRHALAAHNPKIAHEIQNTKRSGSNQVTPEGGEA